jgi:hypothetical protein
LILENAKLESDPVKKNKIRFSNFFFYTFLNIEDPEKPQVVAITKTGSTESTDISFFKQDKLID